MRVPDRRGFSRRSFLKATGASAAGAGLAACATGPIGEETRRASTAQLAVQEWRRD